MCPAEPNELERWDTREEVREEVRHRYSPGVSVCLSVKIAKLLSSSCSSEHSVDTENATRGLETNVDKTIRVTLKMNTDKKLHFWKLFSLEYQYK